MSQSALLTIFSSGAAASAPFDPVSMFAGGINGWLYNGLAGQSDFLQSAGGSAAGDNDPLGSVEDLSGNANDILQSTGGSKPVCAVSGGINAIKLTSAKYLECTFNDAVAANKTVVFVSSLAGDAGTYGFQSYLFNTNYEYAYTKNDTSPPTLIMGDTTTELGPTDYPANGTTVIVVYQKDIAVGLTVSVYLASDGSLVDSTTYGTFSLSSESKTTLRIGFPVAGATCYIPFHLGIEGLIDTTNLRAYLVETFGGWTP